MDACPVCLEVVEVVDAAGTVQGEAAEDATLLLRCGHSLHVGCAVAWLQRQPRCREPALRAVRHTNAFF